MRLLGMVATLGVLSAPLAAQPVPGAGEAPAEVAWSCWHAAERAALACRLVRAPPGVADAVPVTGAAVLGRIRNDPGSLEDEVVLIPLHGPPVDMVRVARLARAVMCGRLASCVTEFAARP